MNRVRPYGMVGLCVAALLPFCVVHAQAPEQIETAPRASELDRVVEFSIAPQALASAIIEFADQSGIQVVTAGEEVAKLQSSGVKGSHSIAAALTTLLQGTGLRFVAVGVSTVALAGPSAEADTDAPASILAAGTESTQQVDLDAADMESGFAEAGQVTTASVETARRGGIEEIIVTGQKRAERIQDVPIAITALSMEDLTTGQIAGGWDLMTKVPNMTFTKTNFSGYSIQIRGIGTQAISATTDPAVAIAFNNTPMIHNRLFEQEFYDLERIEILRGPQGTLYGRNATAGVVNIISAKPGFDFDSKLSMDIGNYNSRRYEGMVNIPLVDDIAAFRLAGAITQRDGYATNEMSGKSIDGRDLWSTRASLRLVPSETFQANFIWEHFEEDDDRIRSGKQLCKKDVRSNINGVPFPFESQPGINGSPAGTYNQGCVRNSLYAKDSFQTPNGFALPYVHPLYQVGLPITVGLDPYANATQSRDLRIVESVVDPQYRAQADIFELQLKWDLGESLKLESETAYNTDRSFSSQDYNRFATSRGIFNQAQYDRNVEIGNVPIPGVLRDGVFCDPQIGCSDRLVAVDLSTTRSTQLSQEFRLSTILDGPVNFSIGANYTRFETINDYYVFFNTLTLFSAIRYSQNTFELGQGPTWAPGISDNRDCLINGPAHADPTQVHDLTRCVAIDPNPINRVTGEGHNYFLSRNPYELNSYGLFGELYYNITDTLKLTTGLRYTVDQKHAPLHPSWLLAAQSVGHPVKEELNLEWREPSGRLVLDWKPQLDINAIDETLIYASYARGYKAGGANTPPMVIVAGQLEQVSGISESVLHPKTFDAEFVNAFELGSKTSFLDKRVTLNVAGFFYDYEGYQISRIVDRAAVNSNFDAKIWGVEIETDWMATEALKLGFRGGYTKTRMADGSQAIDLMDRTAGNPDWVISKPFPSLASNCILPAWLATFGGNINTIPETGFTAGDTGYCVEAYVKGNDPVTRLPYVENPTQFASMHGALSPVPAHWSGYAGFDPATAPNNGAGFAKDLSGNELPNAPNYTATLMADYSTPLRGNWVVTLHTDLYWQSSAWWSIFNDHEYARLRPYYTANVAAIFANDQAGWNIMAYVKNVVDRDSITGAFLNSDDTGLTTNVFLTEPRLYGLRFTKHF